MYATVFNKSMSAVTATNIVNELMPSHTNGDNGQRMPWRIRLYESLSIRI
jgi:hypothetical protein